MRKLVLSVALIALGVAPALAQDTGSVLVFYDGTIGVEAEVHVPDNPTLSAVFRLRPLDGMDGMEAEPDPSITGGIRYHLPVGPVRLFAHYLYGNVDLDPDAEHVGGGGVEIPLRRSWFMRVSADHDGDSPQARVGVGVRF